MTQPLLEVSELSVTFPSEAGPVAAVRGLSYRVMPGEVLGIVGESGSGKSVSMLSVLGLIPQPPGRIASGKAIFKGRDLLTKPTAAAARALCTDSRPSVGIATVDVTADSYESLVDAAASLATEAQREGGDRWRRTAADATAQER